MPDQYYDSTLTGQQLDAAFAKMANIDTYVSQAASSASEASGYAETATSAASQAQTYASQANTAKNNAQTYAGQASDSADSAQTYAGQASGSASAAAASAASIEGDVEAAANSASQAATSASQAAESASDAADAAQTADDAKSTVQQSASAAQTAATQAAQSAQDAQSAATQASGSASTAQSAATLIEDNLEAIQAAPTNAQAAQTSAQAAEASASAAEAAADRAEQIADFDPADFATAEQGAKADSAVQSVNGVKPDGSGNVQLDLTTGTVRSVNGKDPDGSGNVQLSAGDVGAATAAQGALAATAVQPSDLDEYAKAGDIPKKLPNPQALGIRLGSGGSVTAYDGSVSRTVTITPEAIGAQPAGAASGGEVTLIANTGLTAWSQGSHYDSSSLATGGYDMVGIVCLCNGATAEDEYSPIQWFPIPARGQSRKYGLFCMDVNGSPMGEAQVRMISITNNGSTIRIYSDTPGYYYNWGNKGQENRCAVPVFIYGMKF